MQIEFNKSMCVTKAAQKELSKALLDEVANSLNYPNDIETSLRMFAGLTAISNAVKEALDKTKDVLKSSVDQLETLPGNPLSGKDFVLDDNIFRLTFKDEYNWNGTCDDNHLHAHKETEIAQLEDNLKKQRVALKGIEAGILANHPTMKPLRHYLYSVSFQGSTMDTKK